MISRKIILVALFTSCTLQQKEMLDQAGLYLGQTHPGLVPEIFADGVVSTAGVGSGVELQVTLGWCVGVFNFGHMF